MRRVLATLALGAVWTLGQPALAVDTSTATGPVPLRTAAQVLDSMGINVHVSYVNTSYRDSARVARLVHDLGITHVRDALKVGRPDQDRALRLLAQGGARSLLIAGNPRHVRQSGTTAQAVRWLQQHGSAVEALEGADQWDCSGDPAWERTLHGYEAELARALTAARIAQPLLGPSFCRTGSPDRYGADRDQAATNAHVFAAGSGPEAVLADALAETATTRPGVPTWVTETGYHDAVNGGHAQPGVSRDAQATYLLRTVLEAARLGVPRTYLYELLDERPDPDDVTARYHFGVVDSGGRPKPAYTALRAVTRVLSAAGRNAAPAVASRLTSDAADGVRQLVLSGGPGREVVFAWRPDAVWDTATRTPLPTKTTSVTWTAPAGASWSLDRLDGTPATTGRGARRTLQVGPRPVALSVRLPAATVAPTATAGPAAPSAAPSPRTPVIAITRSKGDHVPLAAVGSGAAAVLVGVSIAFALRRSRT